MKIAITLGLVAAAAVGAKMWLCGPCCCGTECPLPAEEQSISGHYVEARTASVFAGACHYNGEYVTAGREQVLAWRIESGAVDGVSLAGVDVVAAIGCEDNLDIATAPRKSVLYVDRDASERQRELAVKWVRSQHTAALGNVIAVEPADVVVDNDGESYHVKVGDTVALEGTAMPDRACCTQPFKVWYAPAEKLDTRLVGCSKNFTCNESRLGVRWSREGANDAFLGRFGAATL